MYKYVVQRSCTHYYYGGINICVEYRLRMQSPNVKVETSRKHVNEMHIISDTKGTPPSPEVTYYVLNDLYVRYPYVYVRIAHIYGYV
jgi:hypothetical protein